MVILRIPASIRARQLARPHGLLAGRTLDKLDAANAARMRACVEAAGTRAGETGADFGFGGGAGLAALLDAVGPTGHVHGVEMSAAALRRARRCFRDQVRAGRLELHDGTLSVAPLPAHCLDVVTSTNTLYFVPNLEPVGRELGRLAAPGARVVVAVANPERMRDSDMPLDGFVLRPVDELVAGLTSSGDLTCHGVRELPDDPMGFSLLVLGPAGRTP